MSNNLIGMIISGVGIFVLLWAVISSFCSMLKGATITKGCK